MLSKSLHWHKFTLIAGALILSATISKGEGAGQRNCVGTTPMELQSPTIQERLQGNAETLAFPTGGLSCVPACAFNFWNNTYHNDVLYTYCVQMCSLGRQLGCNALFDKCTSLETVSIVNKIKGKTAMEICLLAYHSMCF